MEIIVLEHDKSDGKASFLLKKSNPAFANTLRRVVIEQVPTMAIEDVEFRKNSSILYDEIISHRLGLIPLKTDLKSYNLQSKCKCKGEGCARCSLKLTLKAKGPGMVYASDIKSKDSAVKPAFPKMPIVKLLKGQEIELEATAILGQGKNHAKWGPGLIYYKYKPVIEIGDSIKNPEDVANSCPVNVFDVKNDKISINKDNYLKCHLCGACQDTNPKIKLNESNEEFVFNIESWGQLSPKEILVRAVDIFEEQQEEFIQLIKKA